MGSIAHDSGEGKSGAAVRHPISTHPAFPFIVALWFAALLGIGSLVVPVQVVEHIVAATGLSAPFPQAAPPLGFTARALIAVLCSMGGGLVGLLIARKVARAHRVERTDRFADTAATARRPIAAHDELGEDGFDGAAPRGRRMLAIAEEEEPGEGLAVAPGPGRHLSLSALDLHEAEALELVEEAVPVVTVDSAKPPPSEPLAPPGSSSSAKAPSADDLVMHDRLPERDEDAGVLEPVAPEAPATMPGAPAAVETADWQGGDLDDLALVQLAERLGSSIARRREVRAAREAEAAEAAAAAAPAAAVQPVAPLTVGGPMSALLAEDFAAAEAAEAATAMAAYFNNAAPRAAAPGAGSEPVARSVPTQGQPAGARQVFQSVPPEAPVDPASPLAGLARIDLGEEDDADEGDAVEPALVLPGENAAAKPFDRPLAVAATPAAAPPARVDTAENERALRDALLNLQRMSSVG